MKSLNGYISICVVVVLLWGMPFLGEGGLSAAERSRMDAHAPVVELTAPIMEINLVNDYIVVAEKKIQLLSTVMGGAKVWVTVFQDASGNRISFNNFRQHDRVRIKGVRAGFGGIDAHEITLLPSARGIMPSQQQPVPSSLK